MTINELINQKNNLDEQARLFEQSAKNAIENELNRLFDTYEDIQNIKWAQKNSEYDDEGMYPGIAGPVINNEADINSRYGNSWIYDLRNTDHRLNNLYSILSTIDADILVDIYNDQCIVSASRKPDGGIRIEYDWVY